MSILPGAHDFVITSSEFRINQQTGQHGIDILLDASTPEASVDAGERDYAPSCYPDTRVQYIEDITTWATANNGDHLPIYWMRGPAGVGKSAIAQTCAQRVKDAGYLGAAFFFSINGRRKDHTRLFPTLAYQLATTLPDYRENVNHCVLNDKTIVMKTMRAQFESLIVGPLRQLKEQGREAQMRSIFIDGLDECESQDAQVEIIKIIASSVQAESTPFRWAIFSRAEPRIVSTFKLSHISPYCRLVYLPISRDSDKEIEIYLRGGFENILRRRDMTLSSPWPTDDDIRKLIDAAAGLFAYCATVLRFIDTYSFSGFKETLQVVLKVIAQRQPHTIPLFSDLDRLYTLILQRVPEDILPLTLLFFQFRPGYNLAFNVATVCNVLGISETFFRSMCYHLQAVMTYQGPIQPLQVDPHIDYMRSPWDQDAPFEPSTYHKLHGSAYLLHKSFHDFLHDPGRSSTFCTSTDVTRELFIGHLIQRHHHYASSYVIQGSKLVLAPGAMNSSASLSWPQGTEFVDSYLEIVAFCSTSHDLTLNAVGFTSYATALSPPVGRKLMELDYRKFCIAERMLLGLGLSSHFVLSCHGHVRTINDTTFRCVRSEAFSGTNPALFLHWVEQLEEWGTAKAFRSRIPTALALVHKSDSRARTKPGNRYGVYKLGRGEKSVMWYWEFDVNEQYYHEFMTTNYAEAMRIYKTEKFKMWEESWVLPSA